MADIVNLRSVRKAKDRLERRATADENAANFGRTKADKALTAAQADKANRDLDGAKRE